MDDCSRTRENIGLFMLRSTRRVRRFFTLLGLLMTCHGPLWAQETQPTSRAIDIPKVERPPRLEDFLPARGSLADLPGAGVRVIDFRQREPGDGVPVSQATAAYLSYDNQNLYVVFVCTDEPGKVRANVARREDISDDDQVVLYVDTFHDRKRAYLFAVNPAGVQQDGVLTEGQDEDMSFDTIWTSEGRMTDSGYLVRIAIPFRSLRFANHSEQTWGIALGRVIRRNNEESYWPHVTKQIRGFVPQFGDVQGLAQISPGRNIQVETDDPQVTVNERFEVFFPEKRPFFLENAGYFQTPINLLFSRRIVDPWTGLRLTGKADRWAIGALAMNDRQLDQLDRDDPEYGNDMWIGALRVQREFGKENSAGMLVSDQQFLGSPRQARSYSADARWSMGDNWSLPGQPVRTETRKHDGPRLAD